MSLRGREGVGEVQGTELPGLSTGAKRLVDLVAEQAPEGTPGINQWLLALLQRHGGMAEAMSDGLNAALLIEHLRQRISEGEMGAPLDPDTLCLRAGALAASRGLALAAEPELASVILSTAGYDVADPDAPDGAEPAQISGEQPAGEAVSTSSFVPRSQRPTPALERFGRDLTRAAVEGRLGHVVGREAEIDLMIETLCRRTKRNPVLVGPAGVGKTAIVEGLAQRIVAGEVPRTLQGVRLFELQPSTLVAGTGVVGELNERMKALLAEGSHEGIILFIDEVHTMIGAGGPVGTGDIASLLKPALARGDLACIAATTNEEYRRFIEPDEALERRFQPIRVQEPTAAQTLSILQAVRDDLQALRNVTVDDAILLRLVDFAAEHLRNRHFPDKAVDLLEQCVAHALAGGRDIVSRVDADVVAQRMIGMPADLDTQLEVLRTRLAERGLLRPEDQEALLTRLSVSLRGLDIRSVRPNAVVLLIGEMEEAAGALAELISDALFGSPERLVTIDFGQFTHPADVTRLIGASPGYIGYDASTPLHRLAQMPWCALLVENIDSAHPAVTRVFAQALDAGSIADARDKRIFLSDTIVLLTAAVGAAREHAIGFIKSPEAAVSVPRERLEEAIGREMMDQIDLVISRGPSAGGDQRLWLRQSVLAALSERYRMQGIDLRCDDTLVDWLLNQQPREADLRHWERMVDELVSPVILRALGRESADSTRPLLVRVQSGMVEVTPETGEGGSE
jgi:ATP-dependent Clp protease ATP-binding subunit ClpC